MTDVIYSMSLRLLAFVLVVYAFVAAGDVLYQRFHMAPAPQDDARGTEAGIQGFRRSPEIKAKIRKIRAERLRRRMMSAVPQASVIITNPTHYAVALKYEAG